MGMCLKYSLLKPQEVLNIMETQEKQKELPPANSNLPSLPEPEPTPCAVAVHTVQPPSLFGETSNMENLETALVPISSPEKPIEDDIHFDLTEIMKDFQEQNDDKDALIMATTQIEKQVTTSTTVFKTNSPQQKPFQTFNNCKFGNIGTLNIHIHKH